MKVRKYSIKKALKVGRGGRVRPTAETANAVDSFHKLTSVFVASFSKLTSAEQWSASLVLTMAVTTPEDLAGISTSGFVHQTPCGPLLEWTRPDGQRDARELSVFALLSLRRTVDIRAEGRLAEQVVRVVTKLDPNLSKSKSVLEDVLSWSTAWAFTRLPGFMFSHIARLASMTPLKSSAWTRLNTRLPLDFCEDATRSDADADNLSCVMAYANSTGLDTDASVIEKILKSCRLSSEVDKSDRALLDELASQLRSHLDAVETAGPLTALLLNASLTLAYENELRPRTIQRYLTVGIPIVFSSLAGLELFKLRTPEAMKSLSEALNGIDGQARNDARAFISHFWRITSERIPLCELDTSEFPSAVRSNVKANVVWAHELARVLAWIEGGCSDALLRTHMCLILELLSSLPVRPEEILSLQLRNLKPRADGTLEIEITRIGRLHGLKSPSASRFLAVPPAVATQLLNAVVMRGDDWPRSSALVFGTKSEPKLVYRRHEMYRWMTSALKQVTGDTDISLYSLRHTAIDGECFKMNMNEISTGALQKFSSFAGHLNVSTTCVNYFHRYMHLLNNYLFRALTADIRATSTSMGRLLDVNGASFRKMSLRFAASGSCRVSGTNSIYWSLLRAKVKAASTSVSPLCQPTRSSAEPPAALRPARQWTAEDLLNALIDVQQHRTPLHLALSQRFVPSSFADTITTEISNICRLELRAGRSNKHLPPLLDINEMLAFLNLDLASAKHDKFESWLYDISHNDPPDLTDAIWDEFSATAFHEYISLRIKRQPHLFLSFMLSSGCPPERIVLCVPHDRLDALATANAIRLLSVVGTNYRPDLINIFVVNHNNRRGQVYLLYGQPNELLTIANGRAFSPAGVRAIMLALRLKFVCNQFEKRKP